MTAAPQGTRFSCAATVTVIPAGITTVSPHVGYLPNDQVADVPQLPFTDAVIVTAHEMTEYKSNSKLPAINLVPVFTTIHFE